MDLNTFPLNFDNSTAEELEEVAVLEEVTDTECEADSDRPEGDPETNWLPVRCAAVGRRQHIALGVDPPIACAHLKR